MTLKNTFNCIPVSQTEESKRLILINSFILINIEYDNKKISNSSHIKFLGINIVNKLSWKSHIDQLLPKLSSACYAIRAIKPYVNQETLLISIPLWVTVIIFWGNSSYNINIFCLQKKVIRIMSSTRNRNSRIQLFKILKILPFQSQYIYSLLCFVINNTEQYQFISEVHNRTTRQGPNLY
jgi:hypothetical protein